MIGWMTVSPAHISYHTTRLTARTMGVGTVCWCVRFCWLLSHFKCYLLLLFSRYYFIKSEYITQTTLPFVYLLFILYLNTKTNIFTFQITCNILLRASDAIIQIPQKVHPYKGHNSKIHLTNGMYHPCLISFIGGMVVYVWMKQVNC